MRDPSCTHEDILYVGDTAGRTELCEWPILCPRSETHDRRNVELLMGHTPGLDSVESMSHMKEKPCLPLNVLSESWALWTGAISRHGKGEHQGPASASA